MKSKMKTTFAIIAVALMVLVAVVPMVSILTGSSDAAAQDYPIPSTDTKVINVNVTVYQADGATLVDDGVNSNVMITYGTGSSKYTWTVATATGVSAFVIHESAVSSLTISYVDSEGNKIANYNDVTITNLEASKTYNATMIAGKLSKTVALGFKNAVGQGAMNFAFNTNIIGVTALKFKAYSDEECTTLVDEGTFTITSDVNGVIYGTFSYAYTDADLYLKLSGLTLSPSTSTIAVNDVAVEVTGQTDIIPIVKQSLVKLAPNALFKSDVVVDSLVEEAEASPATFSVINGKNVLLSNGNDSKYAYFSGIPSANATGYKVVLKADGTTSESLVTNIADGSITLGSKYIGGTVKLGNTTQVGKLEAKIAVGEESPASFKANTDAKGNFFVFLDKAPVASAAISDATFTVSDGSSSRIFTVNGATYISAGVAMSLTGAQGDLTYDQVKGTLYVSSVANANKISATLTVSGSKTFGSLDAVSGAFDFYAVKGSTITFGAGASLSGSTSVVVGTATDNLSLVMDTKDITISLTDSANNKITGATAANIVVLNGDEVTPITVTSSSNKYTIEVRGDLSSAKVYFTGLAYAFAAADPDTAVALVDKSTYTALNGKYTVQMVDVEGKPVYTPVNNGESTYIALYNATVYKTTAGTYIYNYDDTEPIALANAKYPSTADNNAYSFTAYATEMAVKTDDIKTTPIDVIVAVPLEAGVAEAKCIFDSIYLLSGSVSMVEGYYDYVYGKLTRIDGQTPIAGATVDLYYDGVSKSAAKTTTSLDGTFTIFSKVEIDPDSAQDPAAEKAKWTVGFTTTGYNAGAEEKIALYTTSGAEKSSFTYSKDTYAFEYYDADGEEISTANATITIGNAAPASTYKWKAGDEVKVTMTYTAAAAPAVAGATYRTFSTHVITADEAATGIVKFVSDQSTYYITTVDGSGDEIANTTLNLYYYVNDVPMVKKVAGGAAVTTTTGNDGIGSFLLPYIDVTVTAASGTATTDVIGTEYAVLATKNNAGFSDELVDIEYAVTVIASEYEALKFIVLDAAGENIVLAGDGAGMGTAKVYKDGEEINAALNATPITVLGVQYQTYSFVNDPDADYTFTINATTGDNVYTFEEKLSPVLGVLRANEEWVVGDIYDSAGLHIPAAANKKVNVYTTAAANPVESQAYVYNEATNVGYWKVLIDTDLIVGFIPEEIPGYTFGLSVESDIYANERSISPVFGAINGIPGVPQNYTFYAYLADGTIRSAAAVAGVATLIIDPTDVETYAVKLTNDGADGYFVKGETYYSESSLIVSPYSKITGSLPVKAADGDYVAVELWDEGIVVDGKQAELDANETSYEVFIDISGDDAVAGVAFDSITATYVHNGMVYAISEVNPTSAYNPIVSDPGYALVLIGSDLILEHTDFAVVGNIAYLTADTMFEIVVQTTQVEGKQVVEKYTFAGWYINGKAVNASEPSISVELTEFANTASAKYNVETYEVVEPTPEPTPAPAVDNSIDPTVLVIGICAVIVALIAVAYAVISSRPKEKKE